MLKRTGIAVVMGCLILCGCVKTVTRQELGDAISSHGHETISWVSYAGSMDGYHYLRHGYTLGSTDYRIAESQLHISNPFPLTKDETKWRPLKNNWEWWSASSTDTNLLGRLLATASNRPQSGVRQAPALSEKRKNLMLGRVVELMRESGHWDDYPLRSVEFDEKRQQWEFVFSGMKPDEGYAVFIKDEQAERIDIRLLPPVWTKYERKGSGTRMPGTPAR